MRITNNFVYLLLVTTAVFFGLLIEGRSSAGIVSEVEQIYRQIIQPVKATNKTYHKFNSIANYKMNLGEVYARTLRQFNLFGTATEVKNAYARESSEMRRINHNHVERARNPLRNILRLMAGGSMERYDTKEACSAFKRDDFLQQAIEDRKRMKDKMLELLRAKGLEQDFAKVLMGFASEKGITLMAGDIKNEGIIVIQGKAVFVNDMDNKITRDDKKKAAADPVVSAGIEERVRSLPADRIGARMENLHGLWKTTTDPRTRKNIEYEISLLKDRLDKAVEMKDACPPGSLKKKPGICGCDVSDIDSDKDGVPDCKDKCPGTRVRERVNAQGCSKGQMDSDNDGIADERDRCPNTPRGERVDAAGCSQKQLSALAGKAGETSADPFVGSWRMTVRVVRHSDPEAMKEAGRMSEVTRLIINKTAAGYAFSGLSPDMKVTSASVSGNTMTVTGTSGIDYGMGYDRFTMRLSLQAGNSRISGMLRYDHTSSLSVDGKASWNENSLEAVRQ